MRRIDLTCDILSPVAFSLFLFYLGTSAAIIFVVAWNSVSLIPEYIILRNVYHIVPSLSQKGWEQAAGEEKGEEEEGDRAIDKKEGEIGITRKGGRSQEEEEVRGGRRGVDLRFVLDMIHLFIFRYFIYFSLSLSLSLPHRTPPLRLTTPPNLSIPSSLSREALPHTHSSASSSRHSATFPCM